MIIDWVIISIIILVLIIVCVLIFIYCNHEVSQVPVSKYDQKIPIYYWIEGPNEVSAANGVDYLRNNVHTNGHFLAENTMTIPIKDSYDMMNKLTTYVQSGGRIAISTSGSEILEEIVPWLSAHPQLLLLNMFSTANMPLSSNILRFAIPDSTTFSYVTKMIPQDTVVYYDETDEWANASASYFKSKGYQTISYAQSMTEIIPTSNTYLIIGVKATPLLMNKLPLTATKVYGLDGSLFYPLTGEASNKAQKTSFECITYSPLILSPLIGEVDKAIGTQTNYIFPSCLDAITYARYYLTGMPSNEIQDTVTGFTGSLQFVDQNREFGNLAWYTYVGDNSWSLTTTTILNQSGYCNIKND